MASERRQVLLHPDTEGWWVAECPSLPGAVSQGRDRDEALRNIREAIQGVIATLKAHGKPVPPDDVVVSTVTV